MELVAFLYLFSALFCAFSLGFLKIGQKSYGVIKPDFLVAIIVILIPFVNVLVGIMALTASMDQEP